MNTAAHWRLVSTLLNDALELPASARPSFLEERCGDAEVVREVLDLLPDERSGHRPGPTRPFFVLSAGASAAATAGQRIGPYRLSRPIGQGGMGAVWLAERVDGEFEQLVAIKLLDSRFSSATVLRRFRAERQILAKMSHPNVASLVDGGTDKAGLSYLVMEYVDGLPIDEHCNSRALGLKERIALFRSLCEAVSFAHRNLVVHRDLKPANVLVTPAGQVKLLDFGIARLLRSEQPQLTQDGSVPLTPLYASPEQVRGRPVNTASDIYSLGVLLYELLTGRRPHDHRRADGLPRAICHEPPRRPSAVDAGGKFRAKHPRRFRRRLSGDLDNIVLRALRKEPERRFRSVEELSDDLHRYLTGRPVRSRPATLLYRAGRFVRRNRFAVASAGLVIALGIAFVVSTVVQNRRLASQYEATVRERARSAAVTDLLVDILGRSDPRAAKGETPTVRRVLDETSARLRTEMTEEPITRAALFDAVGRVYSSLDLGDEARSAIDQGLRLRTRHLDPHDPALAESLHSLAELERNQGSWQEAERLMRRAITIQRKTFPDGHSDLAAGLNNLAALLRRRGTGGTGEAESLAREALAMQERLLGGDHVNISTTLNTLGLILVDQARYDGAESCYRRSCKILRQSEGPDHPYLAKTLNNLAVLLADHRDRGHEALPLYEESARIQRKVYPQGHTSLLIATHNLAVVNVALGRLAEARELFDGLFAVAGEDHPAWSVFRKSFALYLAQAGDYEQCLETTEEVIPLLASRLDRVGEAKSIRGSCLAALGRCGEAGPLLREGNEALLQAVGEDNRRGREARERLAAFRSSQCPGHLAAVG